MIGGGDRWCGRGGPGRPGWSVGAVSSGVSSGLTAAPSTHGQQSPVSQSSVMAGERERE